MAQKRDQRQQVFWLDRNKPAEVDVAREIKSLKKHRLYHQTIRDGIMLLKELRVGRLDMLYRLFPRLYDWLVPAEDYLETVAENDALRREVEAYRLSVDKLSEIIAAQQQSAPALTPGPQRINVAPVAVPTFDDDDEDITLEITPRDGSEAAHNFVDSVQALVQ